ncbi:prepilin-type N-terminal cleavage/methylation domain-containing protein [Pseudoalteromonas sp. SR43-6]|uniref:prepilin-type N-terminal cleavage/methylation domain-containing protein n=1 Tax=unclassified Pseudoalteromonas TaxID=194690 RepID=UPI0015F845A3|nr:MULTISPECIES: prepilin-type N-terminal cleavage/methylation domain-containing protein [unclassified Pseudoalteromonas]MBB1290109.1 prepilin-type N-terminal cleavage/methylation domain-containing protein [Pseudoalteromonas sp. SR41-5]MBB1373758.1 prepilin-type N-terminal cleavage/methylation domain-containing protein [Pseudoalteromonas sp. SR43-6]MBB1412809.1 prepilin-type N-terminal cleavage/methylation domain-containing protein [Pseudoalteromonas sp. SG43-8]
MKTQSLKSLPMNKQAGFTLVELIIVIVILGILAVTAAPRFLNLQGDANASTLEGLQGSIRSGMNIVNGKSIIASNHKKVSAKVTVDTGDAVDTVYGYPAATEAAFEAFLDVDFADGTADVDGTDDTVDSKDFNIDTATANKAIIFPNSYLVGDDCRIEYTAATNSGDATSSVVVVPPVITLVTTGC